MTKLPLPYVHAVTKPNGQVYYYFRRDGRHVRIPGDPKSREFVESYTALRTGTDASTRAPRAQPVAPGSIAAAVALYLRSADFAALAPRTQQIRRATLTEAAHRAGAAPLAALTDRDIRAAMVERRPHAAITLMKALRGLFSWAIDARLVDSDPTRGVKRPKIKSEGWPTWTIEDIEQFERRHPEGSRARLALTILLWTGARRADVARLGPINRRPGNVLRWQTQKGGTWVEIPVLPTLAAALDAVSRDRPAFLVTEAGRPFSVAGFGNWFGDRCREAGLVRRSAHGLRKAAAVRLAESGASTSELMAIFGWRKVEMAELYTRAAQRNRMARAGMSRLTENGQ